MKNTSTWFLDSTNQLACSCSYFKTRIYLRFILGHILVIKEFLKVVLTGKNYKRLKICFKPGSECIMRPIFFQNFVLQVKFHYNFNHCFSSNKSLFSNKRLFEKIIGEHPPLTIRPSRFIYSTSTFYLLI